MLGRKLRGFDAPDAVLTAVETRSSSPVRIVRDSVSFQSALRGLYPCGEGAGYAGGITSAAVDGLRVAEAIVAARRPLALEEATRALAVGNAVIFLTPAYEKTLRDTAARCGYDIVFFPSSRAAEGNVDDCTILYGHPSQRVIAGARNLKWYASCWAGVDHFCRDDLYQNPDCLLTNASGAYGTTIAEHSVMVSLMLLRRQMEYTEIIREGGWRVLPGGIHSLHGICPPCARVPSHELDRRQPQRPRERGL